MIPSIYYSYRGHRTLCYNVRTHSWLHAHTDLRIGHIRIRHREREVDGLANTSNAGRWTKLAGAGALALSLTMAAWAHERLVVRQAPLSEGTPAAVAVQAAPGGTGGTAAAKPTGPAIVTYTVQNGDTLWDIAIKHNTDVESIMALNGLTRSSSLKIGQTLRILTIKGTVHKVRAGDTLSSIANSYGVGINTIVQANGISNQNALAIGQELIIPGGQPKLIATAETSRGSVKRSTSSSSSGSTKSSAKSGSLGIAFGWPVRGPITSGFGSRWGSIHTGIDIAVPSGTPVKASRAGTVTAAGWMDGYGYAVIIDHGDGYSTLYGHNSKLLVSAGEHVTAGQVIARSGSTGHSTGPHVHFEIRRSGKAINPLLGLK